MATKHGNRVYIQVLLDPFRGELFVQDCEAAEIKPSAKIRQLVYDYLSQELPQDDYLDAHIQDIKNGVKLLNHAWLLVPQIVNNALVRKNRTRLQRPNVRHRLLQKQ